MAKYENVEKISELLGENGLGEVMKKLSATEKSLSDVLKNLSVLEEEKVARDAAMKAEEARLAEEANAKAQAAEKARLEAEKAAQEKLEAEKAKAQETEEVKQEKPKKAQNMYMTLMNLEYLKVILQKKWYKKTL